MKKCQLIVDMAQDRKYWLTKIMAGPVQGYCILGQYMELYYIHNVIYIRLWEVFLQHRICVIGFIGSRGTMW